MAVHLPTRAPFDAGALLAFLARRAVAGVEEVSDGTYRRSLRLAHGAGTAELRAAASGVGARFELDDRRDLDEAVGQVRALFDLDADPAAALGALGRDELIGPLVRATPGRRVAGHVHPHELAVRAVLGQQVSVAAAAGLAARLVAEHGERLARPLGTVTHRFPAVETLAALSPERLPMPRSRARALVALTGALATGDLVLRSGADLGEARRGLLALPGIGPWTASYIALRGLGDRDAFPAGDLGIRRALERLGRQADPAGAERLAERWRPHRADAAEHLWASVPDP